MFNGFTDETFTFFLAIRFNNNRAFFQENHDWYERAVRQPLLALSADLAVEARKLDEEMELRPNKCVSRINRDIRYARDKSPYRDYMWLSFRRPGPDRGTRLGAYFDIGEEGASFGAGIFDKNVPLMNALRQKIQTEPERLTALVKRAEKEFTLHANTNRRLRVPEGTPAELEAWFPLKGFYLERDADDFDLLRSPALVGEIARGWEALGPLYRYLQSLTPTEA